MYLKKFLKQYFNSIFKSIFNNNLSFHQKLFIYGLYLSYLLYFITLIGLSAAISAYGVVPEWLGILKTFQTFYIALFLIWNFNPYLKKKIRNNNFDRRVAFEAGVFLLATTSLASIMERYFKPISILF
jgi:hypothetical protein